MQNMTNEQAIHIIKQACSSVMADLKTHEQIQTAIAVLEQATAGDKPADDHEHGHLEDLADREQQPIEPVAN